MLMLICFKINYGQLWLLKVTVVNWAVHGKPINPLYFMWGCVV